VLGAGKLEGCSVQDAIFRMQFLGCTLFHIRVNWMRVSIEQTGQRFKAAVFSLLPPTRTAAG
jgi:hypothetical protein